MGKSETILPKLFFSFFIQTLMHRIFQVDFDHSEYYEMNLCLRVEFDQSEILTFQNKFEIE